MKIMKCNGNYDCCGANCDECCRFMDDCDGHPDYVDYNGYWLPIELVENIILAEQGEAEKKAKFTE